MLLKFVCDRVYEALSDAIERAFVDGATRGASRLTGETYEQPVIEAPKTPAKRKTK